MDHRLLPLVHRPVRAPARHDRRTSWSTSCATGAGVELLDGDESASTCRRASVLEGRPRHQHPPDRVRREPARPQRRRRGDCRDLAVPLGARRSRGWIDNFVEIHVATSLEDCEARDVKGLYAKARSARSRSSPASPTRTRRRSNPEIRIETRAAPRRSPPPKSSTWLEAAPGSALTSYLKFAVSHRSASTTARAGRLRHARFRRRLGDDVEGAGCHSESPPAFADRPHGDAGGRGTFTTSPTQALASTATRHHHATPTPRSTARPPCTRRGRRSTRKPTPPADRHLGQRDREPAVAHVVHRRPPGRDQAAHEPCSAARVEVGDRRRPPSRPCTTAAHSEPPSSGRVAPRTTIVVTVAQCPAARPSSSSMSPTTPTTGVGWMSRRATRCRTRRCRRSPGCRAHRTPRSCRRRLRRTATSPRGARGCRS